MKATRVLPFVAVFFILASAGCVSVAEHERQVEALRTQLEAEKHRLTDARMSLEETEEQKARKEAELEQARARAEELENLSERLEQAKLERERNLAEMQELVRDISGMRVEHRMEGDFIVIENEILFDPGQAELKTEAMETLQNSVVPYIKDQLARNSEQMIRIDGHTDGQPIRVSPWKDNYHLSVMRAHSVMSFLAHEGVPEGNLFLAGFGPNQPVVEPPEPDADMAENRRVEILLIPHRDEDIQRILDDFVR